MQTFCFCVLFVITGMLEELQEHVESIDMANGMIYLLTLCRFHDSSHSSVLVTKVVHVSAVNASL